MPHSVVPFRASRSACLWLLMLIFALAPATVAGTAPDGKTVRLTVFKAIDRMEAGGEIAWDQALLYRCQAYKQRDRLPPELAALPYPEQFICPLELFLRARQEKERCRPEIRTALAALGSRPDSIGFVQSSIAPLRVHYETAEQLPLAEEFLGHAEQFYRYFVDVAGFYDTPPDDSRGGSDDYDIYIDSGSYAGIYPEDEWEDSWWSDLRSYTFTQPEGIPNLISTIGHELNHAHQLAMNVGTTTSFFESTATIMEDYAYPEGDWINSELTPYIQDRPYKPIDWHEGGGLPYQYAAFIFPRFLIDFYGADISMVGEIWQGMVQAGENGEPDYFDSIETVIAGYGPETFDEMFRIFTIWRWFTGPHDDGQHCDEADEYAPITLEGDHSAGAFPLNGTAVAEPVAEYGSSFLRFAGGGATDGGGDTCALHFDGDPDKAWSLQLMLFPAGGGDPLYATLEVDEEGFSNIEVPDWTNLDTLVLTVLNLGDGDHDPESFDWDPYHYRYAAVDSGQQRASIVTGPGPGPQNPALVRGIHPDGQVNPYGEFNAYPGQLYGVNLACGDPDGDGTDEILTGGGPGPGVPPEVKLFEATGEEFPIFAFMAYGTPGYGVNVALVDLDGDGRDEILTGPASTYGPHVRAFRYLGGGRVEAMGGTSFLAYGTPRHGVNIAGGDITGDGEMEIITGPGPGPVYGPHVRAFSAQGVPVPGCSFFAYGTLKWGVNVACGDIDGDGFDEIITGAGPGNVFGPHVRAWNHDGSGTVTPIPGVSYFAYGTLRYGVNVTCGDLDGDGIDEIVTGPGPSTLFGAHVRGWNYDGLAVQPIPGCSFFAFDPASYRYGAEVAVGRFWE